MSITVIEAMRDALAGELSLDSRVFVMGEDVGIGGSFQLTLGLADRFGSDRILDTPVSEAGFVGLAIGSAIAGLRPVVDFQYGDFLLCAADQVIQQACKLPYMSGGSLHVPLVLHAPTGASGRGAQHANSIESFFFGVPGLTIAVPSTPYDAKGAMVAAIRHDGPVLICSHKHLYGSKGRTSLGVAGVGEEVPDGAYEIPIGKAIIRRPGSDVTVVGALLMAHRALEAAEILSSRSIDAEVIDLRWLSPLDIDTVLESVERTGRLVVVEEGPRRGGWGATVASGIAERGLDLLDAPIRRLAGPDHAIPFAPHLEAAEIPSVDSIVTTVELLVGARHGG
jgi:pyruvate dehydrogenase E1 component beta subunit